MGPSQDQDSVPLWKGAAFSQAVVVVCHPHSMSHAPQSGTLADMAQDAKKSPRGSLVIKLLAWGQVLRIHVVVHCMFP